MPRYRIEFSSIPHGAGLFSKPEVDRVEFVEVNSDVELQKYIESQKDAYGCKFKKEKSFGYDYISNQGGAKVYLYKPPKFITPKFKRIK